MSPKLPSSPSPSYLSSGEPSGRLRVSIIIPVFNHADLLPRAIRSALDQSYPAREVIVVNDGSTDDSESVARAFGPPVRVVSRPNGGLSAARNSGIALAEGDYLLFLDADDWLQADAVSRLVAAFDRLPPTFGVVACRANQIDATGALLNPPADVALESEATEIGWRDLLLSGRRTRFPCSALVRKEVLRQCGGFDEGFGRLGSEDRDFWLRAAERFRILRLPDRLLNIAVHDANMSADPARQLPGMRRCLTKAIRSGRLPWWHLTLRAKVYAHYFLQAARMLRDRGDRWRAVLNAFLSVAIWPVPGLSGELGYAPWSRPRVLFICFSRLLGNPAGKPLAEAVRAGADAPSQEG